MDNYGNKINLKYMNLQSKNTVVSKNKGSLNKTAPNQTNQTVACHLRVPKVSRSNSCPYEN